MQNILNYVLHADFKHQSAARGLPVLLLPEEVTLALTKGAQLLVANLTETWVRTALALYFKTDCHSAHAGNPQPDLTCSTAQPDLTCSTALNTSTAR